MTTTINRANLTTVVKRDHWVAGFAVQPVNVILWDGKDSTVINGVTTVHVPADRDSVTLSAKRGSGQEPVKINAGYKIVALICATTGANIFDVYPSPTHPVYLALRDITGRI